MPVCKPISLAKGSSKTDHKATTVRAGTHESIYIVPGDVTMSE